MGNVFAAGPGAMPPPPLAPPAPPAPSLSPSPGETAQPPPPQAPPADEGDNPGAFEELHRKCKDIFPMPFEGAKLLINKGLSNHFQISHTLTMSSLQPSGYRFGATYVGTKQISPSEAYPVMVGDIDPSGNLNAQIIHSFTNAIKTKFVAQIQNQKWAATQLQADYRGKDFTATMTLGNPDIVNESGVLVTQYLQKVSSRIALGAELLYQYGSQVPGGEFAIFTAAGRYTGDNCQLSLNLVPMAGGVHACYYHKINEALQVGAELEGSLRTQEATTTIAYQLDLPATNLSFKGQLDSNWCVGAVLEKRLLPLPFTFALSGYANHVKGAYRFGVGLIVG